MVEQIAYDEWKRKDLAARTELLLALGDRQVQMVHDCATSHEVWDLLRTHYEHTYLSSQVTVHRSLINLKMQDNQSAIQFLDDWNAALYQATIVGLRIPDDMQVMILLVALPPSWRPFVTTQSSQANLTLRALTTRIIQEEHMRISHSPSSPSIAMATQFRARSRRPYGRGNPRTRNQSINSPRFPFRQPGYRAPRFNPPSRNFQSPSASYQHSTPRPPFRPQPSSRQSPPFNPQVQCTYCSRVGHLERDCRTKVREQSFPRRP